MQQHEEIEQMAVFRWAQRAEEDYPVLRWLHHIPNGGPRNKAVAAKLKAAGVKAGVPDLCLPAPLHGYKGLYIELKHGKNKPTAEQLEWLGYLAAVGYCTFVCYDREEAIQTLLAYLDGTTEALYGQRKTHGK